MFQENRSGRVAGQKNRFQALFQLSFLKGAHSDIYILGLRLTLLSRGTYNDCDGTINLNSLKSDDKQPGVRSTRLEALA